MPSCARVRRANNDECSTSRMIAGTQGTSGPGGPGPRRAHHGRHHGGGGGGRGAAVNGHTDVAATADVIEAGGGDTGSSGSDGGTPSSLPGLLEDFYNFFNDLFGGGGGQSLPPNYFVYQARLQRARRHPQYPDIDGAAIDIVLNQSPAAPEFCADLHPCNKPPLQKTGLQAVSSSGPRTGTQTGSPNTCEGNWVPTDADEMVQIPYVSPEGTLAIGPAGCACFWHCIPCNGPALYSGSYGPMTRGYPSTANGGCNCYAEPGPETGCPRK